MRDENMRIKKANNQRTSSTRGDMFGVPFTPILPSIQVINGKASPPNRRQQPTTPSSPGIHD